MPCGLCVRIVGLYSAAYSTTQLHTHRTHTHSAVGSKEGVPRRRDKSQLPQSQSNAMPTSALPTSGGDYQDKLHQTAVAAAVVGAESSGKWKRRPSKKMSIADGQQAQAAVVAATASVQPLEQPSTTDGGGKWKRRPSKKVAVPANNMMTQVVSVKSATTLAVHPARAEQQQLTEQQQFTVQAQIAEPAQAQIAEQQQTAQQPAPRRRRTKNDLLTQQQAQTLAQSFVNYEFSIHVTQK